MKIPKIIHQTWKTKDIPYDVYQKEWIDSWKRYHPDWEYKLWTDEDNRALIKEHYPKFLETYDRYDSGIKKCDAARCFILHHEGGIYVDLDFECLKNMESLLENNDLVLGRMSSGIFIRSQIPNAFMASVKGHPFWFSVIGQLYKRRDVACVEHATGPIMLFETFILYNIKRWFSRIFFKLKSKEGMKVYGPSYLYPVSWVKQGLYNRSINESDIPGLKIKYPNAYAITYWCKNWQRP